MNAGLPDNLYTTGNGYYVYQHPITNKRHGMGKDRKMAIEAALELNERLSMHSPLVDRVLSGNVRLALFLETYLKIITNERRHSAKTLKETGYRLTNINKALGQFYLSQIDVRRCAEFLDQFPTRQSNAYRSLLSDIFRYAISKGLAGSNPAADTIPKLCRVQRKRWTVEGFEAARKHAPPFIQRAMDIALHTLLRREDLVRLRFSQYKDGRLRVATLKTGAHIDIRVGQQLDAIIRACRDDALSPCMIHYPLDYRRGYEGKCLTPEALSRAVQRARDKSKHYKGEDNPPTLHEIRSLGAKLYEDRGINPQALLGHADEKMTRMYLDRYEVKWITAEAGL